MGIREEAEAHSHETETLSHLTPIRKRSYLAGAKRVLELADEVMRNTDPNLGNEDPVRLVVAMRRGVQALLREVEGS